MNELLLIKQHDEHLGKWVVVCAGKMTPKRYYCTG